MATEKRLNRIKEAIAKRQKGVYLVLEDIHDPHNAAAALRAADAFGVEEVCVIYEKEKYVNLRRVGRHSSSSANKWLSIRFFRSTKSCYAYLRRKHVRIFGTALGRKTKDLVGTNLSGASVALVFGNEYRGLSQWGTVHADALVAIPMRGFVESLNVSVTVGIFLFETIRQRRQKGKIRGLSVKERQALLRNLANR